MHSFSAELCTHFRRSLSCSDPIWPDFAVNSPSWRTSASHDPAARTVRPMPCAASELAASAVTCDLAGWADCGKITVCVFSTALPDHDPGLWLAGAARPHRGVQACGD